jgi:hypothetical protein
MRLGGERREIGRIESGRVRRRRLTSDRVEVGKRHVRVESRKSVVEREGHALRLGRPPSSSFSWPS